jgi:Uma2 family endonuclease
MSTHHNLPASQIEQVASLGSPRASLPTMYDLPSEDPEESGLPDIFHDLQPQLLSRTLYLSQYSRDRYFSASDLNVYYNWRYPLWHKRPDWFLALNVPRLYDQRDLRLSYVIWQEGQSPYVIIEFLSPGTEMRDLGRFYNEASKIGNEDREPIPYEIEPDGETAQGEKVKPPAKLEAYEQQMRVPHYIVYSRYNQRLRYFKLVRGRYEEQVLSPVVPQIWLADLEIGLGIWQGEFEDVTATWLRWCDAEGNWMLTDTEQARQGAEQERLAKEQERLAKEQAQAQLLAAARNLLATGMTLEQVIQILNLSEDQVAELR